MGVGGPVYLVLAVRKIRKETDAQESLLLEEGLLTA